MLRMRLFHGLLEQREERGEGLRERNRGARRSGSCSAVVAGIWSRLRNLTPLSGLGLAVSRLLSLEAAAHGLTRCLAFAERRRPTRIDASAPDASMFRTAAGDRLAWPRAGLHQKFLTCYDAKSEMLLGSLEALAHVKLPRIVRGPVVRGRGAQSE